MHWKYCIYRSVHIPKFFMRYMTQIKGKPMMLIWKWLKSSTLEPKAWSRIHCCWLIRKFRVFRFIFWTSDFAKIAVSFTIWPSTSNMNGDPAKLTYWNNCFNSHFIIHSYLIKTDYKQHLISNTAIKKIISSHDWKIFIWQDSKSFMVYIDTAFTSNTWNLFSVKCHTDFVNSSISRDEECLYPAAVILLHFTGYGDIITSHYHLKFSLSAPSDINWNVRKINPWIFQRFVEFSSWQILVSN